MMKKFARSNGGKTLIFLLCVLLLSAGTAGLIGFLGMYEQGFYITDAKTLLQELLPPESAEYLSAPERQLLTDLFWFAQNIKSCLLPLSLVALLLAVLCFISLLCTAGKRPEDEEIHAGVLHFLPSDLILAAAVLLTGLCVWLIFDEPFFGSVLLYLAVVTAAALCGAAIAIGCCIFVASRLKQGTFFTNTVIWFACKLLWKCCKEVWAGIRKIGKLFYRGIQKLPLLWKTLLSVGGVCLAEFIALLACWNTEDYLIFWVIEKLLLVPAVFYAAYLLKRLKDGGAALAEGNLSHHTDTKGMYWDFKEHGDHLNSIALGLSKAVEERTKSERMKAELITNVSHDIKTPLTSIISYADLISKEDCDNEKIKEYSEVLLRQSEKLKRLTEDLVEASKASTGNLEILPAPCDAGVLLTQVAGEYQQKLADASLTLVASQPEQPVTIMADGRRMWRVFENLMNNICKYSMEGTRVYLDLQERAGQAIITFRNTSAAALNIAPEELMERFVRGDASRNTEGNGLGLSIAKSFTELQGGSFDISIDGDLFKVVLCFPAIK